MPKSPQLSSKNKEISRSQASGNRLNLENFRCVVSSIFSSQAEAKKKGSRLAIVRNASRATAYP